MSILYNVRRRKDPQNPSSEGQFYGQSLIKGVCGIRELSRRVGYRSGHSPGAIINVLEDAFDAMIHYMSMGYNIEIGQLGIFQLKINSVGYETKDKVQIPECVKRAYVKIVPSEELKAGLAHAEFEKTDYVYYKPEK